MATTPKTLETVPVMLSMKPAAISSLPSRHSQLFKWAIAAVIVVAAAGGGLGWRAHLMSVIAYETAPVERGTVQAKVTATGSLNAVHDVLISSQVSGNIKALYADWNSKVKTGQLIALIDPEIFQAQVDQATAVFRGAHSTSVAAQQQVDKAKSDLSAAIANEKNSEAVAAKDRATEVNATHQWHRAEDLFHQQIMAQQDYDTAKAAYNVAQAQVIADESQIEAAKQNIESAQSTVRAQQSQLLAAQANEAESQAALRQSRANLEHTRIMAPVDGTVVARRMDVGQTVAATLNPPVIFEIAQDLTKMQVDTNVDESDVGSVAIGQKATFVVDAYPEATFKGVVADIRKAPIVAQNVVTYDVVITVDNPSFKLFPGMTANVSILTAKVDDTLKVPTSVLRFRPSTAVAKQTGLAPGPPDSPRMYVLEGKLMKVVPVKVGLSDGKYTAITADGLKPGMAAITKATLKGASTGAVVAAPVGGAPRM